MKYVDKPIKAHLHTLTTLGEQHQLKHDDPDRGPVAIVFHTTGGLGPEPGENWAKRLATCWNACLGLELPDDVTPGALAEVVTVSRELSQAYEETGHGIGSHIDRLDAVLGALETVPRGPFECRPHADQIREEYAASDDPDAVLRKYKLGSLDELGPVSPPHRKLGLPQNRNRVMRARAALMEHVSRSRGADENPPATQLADLLADLRHFAAAKGLDFDNCNRIAGNHYATETPAPPKEVPPPTFDNTQALSEGWALFYDPEDPKIQRDDDQTTFATDDEAVSFVRHQALAGSHYHADALRRAGLLTEP